MDSGTNIFRNIRFGGHVVGEIKYCMTVPVISIYIFSVIIHLSIYIPLSLNIDYIEIPDIKLPYLHGFYLHFLTTISTVFLFCQDYKRVYRIIINIKQHQIQLTFHNCMYPTQCTYLTSKLFNSVPFYVFIIINLY